MVLGTLSGVWGSEVQHAALNPTKTSLCPALSQQQQNLQRNVYVCFSLGQYVSSQGCCVYSGTQESEV
jgi:hypothetical protein